MSETELCKDDLWRAYSIERTDQESSLANQSVLLGVGLAYMGALLGFVEKLPVQRDALLLLPLPVVAIGALLLQNYSVIKIRSQDLRELESLLRRQTGGVPRGAALRGVVFGRGPGLGSIYFQTVMGLLASAFFSLGVVFVLVMLQAAPDRPLRSLAMVLYGIAVTALAAGFMAAESAHTTRYAYRAAGLRSLVQDDD